MALTSAAIGILLLGAAAVAGETQRVLAGMAEMLPDGVVEQAFAATASGLHMLAAAVAALMLAGALAMAALLMRA